MAKKRTHTETLSPPPHPLLRPLHTRRTVKRKLSAPDPASDDSGSGSDTSAPSLPSVSEASALFSSAGSSTTQRSSTTDADVSAASDEDADAESSPLDESSEDTSTAPDSDDDDTLEGEVESESETSSITTVRLGAKPDMRPKQWASGLDGEAEEGGLPLRERLRTFLPRIKAANGALEEERARGVLEGRRLEVVGEGEGAEGAYIEMELGLGVLEERDPEAESSGSGEDEEDGTRDPMRTDGASLRGDRDVMGRLLGQKRKKDGAGIQEVGDGQDL